MDSKTHREYLSASDAAELLGIRKQTLYAYVSRSLVRSVSDGGRTGPSFTCAMICKGCA